MKKINILLLGLIIGIFVSCDKDDIDSKVYSFNGKAQKGPFVTGTNININELNSNLGQTGKTFTTIINSDDGSFSLSNIELNSNLALLTANGFYYSEIYGELSRATLSLQALSDLSGKESVNINVLTHLIKGRIEKLVADGKSFREANDQAKSEFLIFLGVTELFENDFDNFDISIDEDYNAVLLAFSIILQRNSYNVSEIDNITAELTELISKISLDFSNNGIIDETKLIDTLIHNISFADLIDIRENIEKRYSDLGLNVLIPDFQKYINKFQENHCDSIYSNFVYPTESTPEPWYPNDIALNILNYSDSIFIGGGFSLSAISPINNNIKIVVKFTSGKTIPDIYGWKKELTENGFELISQRQNQLMTGLFYTDQPGKAVIEIYENNMEIPVRIKNIEWKPY